ncbi:MAG TPA: hypothetical protein VFU07_09730 [Candidatus Lumbricidophila sp.]|nr:hypothetical protein [Candidatus Lumbricidophila sp.]
MRQDGTTYYPANLTPPTDEQWASIATDWAREAHPQNGPTE